MGDCVLTEEPAKEGFRQHLVTLRKDQKIICRVECVSPPKQIMLGRSATWDLTSFVRKEAIDLSGLRSFSLIPASEDRRQEREWGLFLGFLRNSKRVAIANLRLCDIYILTSDEESKSHIALVYYKWKSSGILATEIMSPPGSQAEAALSNSEMIEDRSSPAQQYPKVNGDSSCDLRAKGSKLGTPALPSTLGIPAAPSKPLMKNFVVAHPSYLKTLGQSHSGWIFGAIAELVDNSRDAKATKLEVSISSIYSKIDEKDIPILSLVDDGCGMSHEDIRRMVSFGHAQLEVDEPDRIGRYGVGFKTGAMRLGNDALVLTQTANSRSIAFLSQSLNEGKDNLEFPIVSYHRIGQFMELDTNVQDKDSAKYNLKTIKKFSPFDKYLIGEKVGLFKENVTGTQIYIWNLDKWGSTYSLEWEAGMTGGSSFHQGGIFTRSRRIRSRPGQMSKKVPLDYSLKSYLEVIFLDPRMKIRVQGALVKCRPLAKSLNKTIVQTGNVLGKKLKLTLGRSQLEWEQANCGIFLYWHGRLIEAYKRVGTMIHSADRGRGIIGVIDVTDLMDGSDGQVWVHSNKQGFQDCEAYAELETWLGEKVEEYLDKYIDKIELTKGQSLCKPDNDWVQCDKCRKWRMLKGDFEIKKLPLEWFCYMKPFNGRCDLPEEDVSGLVTISTKRVGFNTKDQSESIKTLAPKNTTSGTPAKGDGDEDEDEDLPLSFLRKRRQSPHPTSGKKDKK